MARIVELQEQILWEIRHNHDLQLRAVYTPDLSDDLIDDVEIKAILKISDSTLYRLKRSKLINPIRIGRRDYYRKSDIKKG